MMSDYTTKFGNVSGNCSTGVDYGVTSVQDMMDRIGELECMFQAGCGFLGEAVPTGYQYGELIQALGYGEVTPFANPAYYGDFGFEMNCFDSDAESWVQKNFGNLVVAGKNVAISQWETETPLELFGDDYVLGDGEAALNDDSTYLYLTMDFSVDLGATCQQRPPLYNIFDDVAASYYYKPRFMPFNSSPAPIAGYKDLCNFQGIDTESGANLFLCKAMAQALNGTWNTVLFYALKSFSPIAQACPVVRSVTADFEFSYSPLENAIRSTFLGVGAALNNNIREIRRATSPTSIINYLYTKGREGANLLNFFKGDFTLNR